MKRMFTVVLALLVISSSLFAAGVDITGVGVRATNLAGNYRAVSNDWSGMFWNPAGLVWSKGLKAGASVELIAPKVGYSSLPFGGAQFSGTSSSTIYNQDQTFTVPAAGVYYSNEKMAYGVALYAPFGLGAKWDLLATEKYNPNYPELDYEDDLKVIAVQPTFAYKLNDKLSVGLGVMLTYADIMIRKPNFTPNPITFTPAYATLKAALGASALSPFDQFLTDGTLEGSGMGFGVNFGLQFKPMETLTLALSGKYYSTMPLDGTLEATTYYAKDPGNVKPTLDYLKSVGAVSDAQYAQLLGAYSGAQANSIPKMDVTADMPLPITVGAGFAFTGIKNLLVTGDIATSQWSAWDVIEIKDTEGNVKSELVENWENTLRFGLGMEYTLLEAFKLRAGYYNEANAAIPETMQPTVPDVAPRNTIAFGFGLPLGPVELGVLYEKILKGEKTVEAWSPATLPFDNMAGTYSMESTNILFGLEYNF